MKFSKKCHYLAGMLSRAWALVLQAFVPSLKPSAICIGTQKGGTTALFNYFSYHPGVAQPKVKEIDFFNCDAHFSRGISFYHSYFPRSTSANKGKLTFDITPGYISNADKTAKRIYAYNPNIRIIILLRNPITRAYSAWQMYRKFYASDRDWFYKWMQRCDSKGKQNSFLKRSSSFGENFEKDIIEEIEAMQDGQNIEMPILQLGIYHQYVKHYFDYFPKDQILITTSENMKKDTKGELLKIETFIGLEPHTWTDKELMTSNANVGKYNKGMSESEHMLLKSFYQEHNEALFNLLQKEFPWE